MTKTLKGQDGNHCAMITTEEAKKNNMPIEPMVFKTEEEAIERLMTLSQTPEGREEITRIVKKLNAH